MFLTGISPSWLFALYRSETLLPLHPTNAQEPYLRQVKGIGSLPSMALPLLHNNVFIHGPFYFTMTAKGRQSRDRVFAEDWIVLHNHRDLYFNGIPPIKIVAQLYIHCTPLVHTHVDSPKAKVDERSLAMPLLTQDYYR